jgi:hypothetical protein
VPTVRVVGTFEDDAATQRKGRGAEWAGGLSVRLATLASQAVESGVKSLAEGRGPLNGAECVRRRSEGPEISRDVEEDRRGKNH